MNSKKTLALILSATFMTSMMFGCGSSKDKKDVSSKNNSKIDKDQYINLDLATEPKSLDIARANDSYSSQVVAELYEGLTRCEQDENGNDVIKPAGAKSWKHNENGTVWTFYLRDYNWSDGKKVKAQDFVYSIKRTLDPKIASSYAMLLSPIKGAEEYNSGKGSADKVGVKAIDDNTLQFTLKQPCPYFLDLTYFKLFLPQREDIVKSEGEKFGSDAESLKVFCGPFKLTDWVHQNKIVLEKNDKYWDKDAVKLAKVNFKIIKDDNSVYNSLYNGSLDAAGVAEEEWMQKYNKTGKFINRKSYFPNTKYMFFNEKDKLFSNKKVRQAFSIGIDRKEMAKIMFKGMEDPAYAWCPPVVQLDGKEYRKLANYDPVKELMKQNPDPKKLLVEGLKELHMNPDPSKLTVTILEGGTAQHNRDAAEYMQQMFKKTLGVNIKAEYVEWPVFQSKINSYNYQLANMGWTGDYNDPNTYFDMWMTESKTIPTGWSNKKYDSLIKDAQKSLDDKQRLNDYKEAEKILLQDDAAIAPTVYQIRNMYIRKYVKKLMTPLFGTVELKYTYTEGRSK